MPYYDYECATCAQAFEVFRKSMVSSDHETAPACPHCAGVKTQRRVSRVAVLKRMSPGVGRAAYPTSWSAVNQGDKDTIDYWRRRAEKEMSQEASDAGLTQERLISAERSYGEAVRRSAESSNPASHEPASTATATESDAHDSDHVSGSHVHGPGGHTR